MQETEIIFIWIPSHAKIPLNKEVDEMAKNNRNHMHFHPTPILQEDAKRKMKSLIQNTWNRSG